MGVYEECLLSFCCGSKESGSNEQMGLRMSQMGVLVKSGVVDFASESQLFLETCRSCVKSKPR